MRNATKKILVDRLDTALKARGVELKRSAVIEVMAQALGLPNSDLLAKAANDGDLDPPIAAAASHDGRPFAWLRDPVAGGVFAYEPGKLALPGSDRYVLSPYGSLLAVPGEIVAVAERDGVRSDQPQDPWATGTDDDNNLYCQVGIARDIVRLDCGSTHEGMTGLEKYGLERFSQLVDVDVDLNPIIVLTGMGASLVDGRINLTYACTVEYDGHYAATAAIAEMQQIAHQAADALKASGCVLRWTDDPRFGNIEVELHIPSAALVDLQDEEQLEDAILVLLQSPTSYGNHRLKDMMSSPASDVIDADGIGVVDSMPPVHIAYWKDEGRRVPIVVTQEEDGFLLKGTPEIRAARSLTVDVVEIDALEMPGTQQLRLAPLALVDGAPHHHVVLRMLCDPTDQHRRATIATTLETVEARIAPYVVELGGERILQDDGDSMTLHVFLPIIVSRHVHDLDSWKDAIAHLFGDTLREKVEAEYEPQAWQNDYAIDVDPEGDTAIDITWEVLTMDREEAKTFQDNRDFTESLIEALMAPEWIRNRQGPSSIRARYAVDDFLEERQARLDSEAGED